MSTLPQDPPVWMKPHDRPPRRSTCQMHPRRGAAKECNMMRTLIALLVAAASLGSTSAYAVMHQNSHQNNERMCYQDTWRGLPQQNDNCINR
jgi:hypothetical protein